MGDLRLRLNQTQRVRLEAALHELQTLAAAAAAAVTFADNIPVNPEDTILKGHGTSDQDGEVVATVCGVVERVQNLVCVRTLRARYKPQKGDIIIGRVSEIASKRWRLETNFSQGAVLMLSSMNLPDGIQRRRTDIDELNMRSILEENDLVCAEVRHIQHDGSLDLQPRSQKYALQRGQLLTVPAYLVKRRKQHFHHLEQYDADLILGCNGFIWVGEHVAVDEGTNLNEDQHKLSMEVEAFTPLETRRHICRLANAVRVLSALGFTLTVELIIQTAEASLSSHVEISDMLGAEFYVQTAEREAKRRADLSRRMNGPR
ncbi:exosome complex component RRP4 homolog isoform X2 [Triticum urartu]|uniref:exosome complex component RRP4 homolog isoform X2 n=1 Tax=Triticum urartu TaxID=4572 RepID=UPI002042F439|nr:exosome complex component RRP4 homolog isoform X2 [Triticum urartu]